MGEVAHSDSERLAKQRGIVDPAFGVGESLASALAGAYALDRVTVTQVVRRPQMGVDLILDVNTTWWGLRSGPSNPIGRYAVHLEMEAILTDLRSGAVLARGTCTGDDPRTVHGAPYDEFEAENGAKIKRQLGWAAERCERYFRERILGVPSVEVASGR